MHSEQDLLELAEKSGKNDLAFLIKAKEDAKRRMSEEATPATIRAFDNAKSAVDAEVTKLQQPAAPGLTFKTQLAAVDRLNALGFKIKKSKFNTDVKAKRIATNADGHFDDFALQAYAVREQLTPLARAEDAKATGAATGKITADTRLREVQAARQELKLQKEKGLLMPKAQHEAELSARALFFRAELEGFGPRALAGLIHLVGGREDSLQEALLFWAEQIADLMNAWAEDREFAVGDEDEQPEGEESYERDFAEDREVDL